MLCAAVDVSQPSRSEKAGHRAAHHMLDYIECGQLIVDGIESILGDFKPSGRICTFLWRKGEVCG